jgi:hypothetical protein
VRAAALSTASQCRQADSPVYTWLQLEAVQLVRKVLQQALTANIAFCLSIQKIMLSYCIQNNNNHFLKG